MDSDKMRAPSSLRIRHLSRRYLTYSILAIAVSAASPSLAAGGDIEFVATLPADLVRNAQLWHAGRYSFVLEDWGSCLIRATNMGATAGADGHKPRHVTAACGLEALTSDTPRVTVLMTERQDRVVILFETPDYKLNRARVVYLSFDKPQL
jgi:hypothetical protein